MESAIPFLIVAFMFGLSWLVAIGMYMGREQPQEAEVASTVEAVAPELEKTRFLADPELAPAAAGEVVDEAAIVSLERYLREEQTCAARFVSSPSIELLYSGSAASVAVA